MDYRIEILVLGIVLGVVMLVRMVARILPRRRLALAVSVTILAGVTSIIVFRMHDDHYVLGVGFAFGLIAGAIERWLAVWQGDGVKWVP